VHKTFFNVMRTEILGSDLVTVTVGRLNADAYEFTVPIDLAKDYVVGQEVAVEVRPVNDAT
jgi:hypothetical protein